MHALRHARTKSVSIVKNTHDTQMRHFEFRQLLTIHSLLPHVYLILCLVWKTYTTGYLEQGLLVRDSNKLMINYLRGWQLKLDLLALIPTDLFYLVTGVTCEGE